MESKDVKIVGAIGGIAVALIITILGSVFSPVFSPLSESMKEWISGEPNTTITSAKTFDINNENMNKIVNRSEPKIISNSITFNFNASQKPPIGKPTDILGFECSFDGAPFEDCVSPKSYYNLQTESIHSFQVKAKGILGNLDKTPDKFDFATLTSATIQGAIQENKTTYNNATILTLFSKTHPMNVSLTNESGGRFIIEGINQGQHNYTVSTSSDGTKRGIFFVDPGQQGKQLVLDIAEMIGFAKNPPKDKFIEEVKKNPNETNPLFKINNTSKEPHSNTISIAWETKKTTNNTQNPYFTRLWINAPEETLSQIEKVTYYLHPTFNPNIITVYKKENNFGTSFTNWGFFNLGAKVDLKNGTSVNLLLKREDWKI